MAVKIRNFQVSLFFSYLKDSAYTAIKKDTKF